MIDDIEDGKINCVVTKDLSRLGRNYILTGQYTEIYFPSKGVRYIAINDNVDTINGESELAPFLNILNEMHARQTSKKVKAAMHTRFANGAHYGAYGENKQNKNPYGYYHCSKNGQGLRQCSMHYIRYDVLYAYVLARLQYWSMLAQKDEDKLLKRLLNASDRERNSAKKKQAAELKKAEKRKAEVDGLFAKMYEDWSAGRITEYNFNMLSEKYQNEQKELETKIRQLHEMMEAAVQTAADAEKWIALMKQYVNPVELTAELLNTLIEKITVHEAVKGEDGSREQEVEIYYRFIGKID